LNTIDNQFKIFQYDFFISKKFSFYLFETQKTNTRQISKPLIYVTKDIKSINGYKLIGKIEDKDEFIKHLSLLPLYINSPKDRKESFLSFFKNNPKLRIPILQNTYRIIDDFSFENYFFELLLILDKKNIKSFIRNFSNSFSISFWHINKIPLMAIQKNLLINFNTDETHKFWMYFLKSRKNQLKDIKKSPDVANFITEIFSYDKLKIESFFPFFPFLKSKFEEIEPDIFENEYKHTTVIFLNAKSMNKIFNITTFNLDKYFTYLAELSEGIKNFYDIDYSDIIFESRRQGLVHINFYHNNDSITSEKIKKIIIDFFTHLKYNSININLSDYILKWIHQLQLKQDLIINTNNNNNHKIIKI